MRSNAGGGSLVGRTEPALARDLEFLPIPEEVQE
jgi:hypothetical protein